MPGTLQDSGGAVVGKQEKIPVLTEFIIHWSLICINTLMAYVIQREETLFQTILTSTSPVTTSLFLTKVWNLNVCTEKSKVILSVATQTNHCCRWTSLGVEISLYVTGSNLRGCWVYQDLGSWLRSGCSWKGKGWAER